MIRLAQTEQGQWLVAVRFGRRAAAGGCYLGAVLPVSVLSVLIGLLADVALVGWVGALSVGVFLLLARWIARKVVPDADC